ncbi:unnamed protein product [Litomosoides sigmodontis]|uniref:Uncharacterized protein n=1 Tax=Litomosoides sigmodontis TaxID=42156 RepID=A0A3P6TR10_LITSI|nr:unnamed protein product [Litomosoides sigmodontis]
MEEVMEKGWEFFHETSDSIDMLRDGYVVLMTRTSCFAILDDLSPDEVVLLLPVKKESKRGQDEKEEKFYGI